ncbi:hypothetical protein IP79_08475 [Porphyrobacter sp. AAP60]|nr:hypothetical protein IP79_08475 [Porphyrobacter sp. AAP60]
MFIRLQFGIGQGYAGHQQSRAITMRLFSTDLIRNFGIGFVVGTVLVVGANAQSWSGDLASPALAAQMPKAPAVSADFVIAPEGTK